MSLQARLTLWAILLTAAIVCIASALDVKSEFSRQFESTRHDATLIRQFAEEYVKHEIDRDSGAALTPQAAVEADAPDFSSELTQIMSNATPVVEVAICDERLRIIGDSSQSRIGGTCPRLADWNDAVK